MKTEPKTKVVFRVARDKSREVVALFPALAGTNDPWTCSCYVFCGQHSSASVDYVHASRLAKPAEYRDLARELRRIGYRLDIRQRFTAADLAARKEQVTR
jgi:hypothetical protein